MALKIRDASNRDRDHVFVPRDAIFDAPNNDDDGFSRRATFCGVTLCHAEQIFNACAIRGTVWKPLHECNVWSQRCLRRTDGLVVDSCNDMSLHCQQ